jgi:hypothetical protein
MRKTPSKSPIPHDNDTVIECSHCGFQKIVNIAKFCENANVENYISKCKCGYAFDVILERRKFERHYFDSDGTVLDESKGGVTYTITVKDLSRSGVKFDIAAKHSLMAGDAIVVGFEFNGSQRTYFIKEATVLHAKGKKVRAQFKTLCGDLAFIARSAVR